MKNIHISSHWEHYLKTGSGFARHSRDNSRARHFLQWIERLTYWPATRQIETSPRVWTETKALLRSNSFAPNFLAFRTACALSVLIRHWEDPPEHFLVIGDGQGLMSALAKWMFLSAIVYSVDLDPILEVQREFHERLGVDCKLIQPGDLASIPKVDAAVNMASMQEMDPQEVARYFDFLRKHEALFYCINREEKKLRGGELLRFADYPCERPTRS